jgi:hypothetical protein
MKDPTESWAIKEVTEEIRKLMKEITLASAKIESELRGVEQAITGLHLPLGEIAKALQSSSKKC